MGVMAFIIALIGFARPPAPPTQPEEDPNWETLAPGIAYREYHLAAPNNIFVARMAISSTQVTLESSIASGYLANGVETVRSMAGRYDQALSQWGVSDSWGSARSDVVVAINGDYFDGNGLPLNGMVQGGWYVKRYTDSGGRTGFGWKFARTPFIGECAYHVPEKQFVRFADGSTQIIHGVNIERSANQLILYTPQYDTNTHTNGDGVEVLVDLSQPALVYPAPKAFTGTIREVRPQGSSLMLFDQAVLSASGNAADNLLAHIQAGEVISISQEIASRQELDCNLPLDGFDWTKTYASVGGDYYFLKDSQPKTYDCSQTPGFCNRLPRTAIAYNQQYVYFIVIDGRDLIDSIGMTVPELSIFARDVLSATHGVTQDGGGSSTMVVNGAVVNNTFCNNYTCRSKIYLPLVSHGSVAPANAQAAPYPAPENGRSPNTNAAPLAKTNVAYERGVANGMMMVVVEPGQRSTRTWGDGQAILVTTSANLRLGPGSNYAARALIPPGTSGTILAHSINGVQAKGYFWWQVRLDTGQEGWLVEEALAAP
jgi:hypothetical protein